MWPLHYLTLRVANERQLLILHSISGIPADASHDGVSILARPGMTRRFLVEYSGEGGEGVDQECQETVDRTQFSWCKAELDCKCQDTFNNTYTCLR